MFKLTVDEVFNAGPKTAVSGLCENKSDFKNTLQDDKGNVYHDVAIEMFVSYVLPESILSQDKRTSLVLKGNYKHEDLLGRVLTTV